MENTEATGATDIATLYEAIQQVCISILGYSTGTYNGDLIGAAKAACGLTQSLTVNEAELFLIQAITGNPNAGLGGLRDILLGGAGPSYALNFTTGGTSYPGISTARASTAYAKTAAGLLVSFAANVARITDLGLLVEEARTNVVLWNRDLTNAAWTKSNVTAALDQTGADGTANSATSLTATAGNGTVLQAITLASSARIQSVWAKRLTGTGTINMTMDNGSTWTAITLTSAYTQLTIPTQTLANPTVGFRIVTSGDAIAVDFVGNTNGTFALSPIPTTIAAVTRAADVISLTGAAASAYLASTAAYFETNLVAGGTSPRMIDTTSSHNWNFATTTTISGHNVTSNATIGGAGTSAGMVKSAMGYDASSITIIANGGTKTTTVAAWGVASGTVYLCNRAAGDRALNGYIRRFMVGLTKGQFDGLTA